jgi:putative transposase
MDRIAPSARLEAQIAELLTQGVAADGERLAELGRLGARLVLQRAVDDEVAAFLGRTRYQRTPTATGSRNGTRPKPIQTAEGEISIAMPQVRNTAERFVSQVIPDTKAVVRTRPLEALIIGGYVRGLSDRDIESLAEEAELGHVSKSTVSRICRELRDRYTAFCNKSLADLNVMALLVDAIYLPTRPSGQKEGVLVAWGYTTEGKRVLVAVRLGQRESHEDWLDLGRDLTRRGLRLPWLVVSDGAPGLIKAIEELWPQADRGRCAAISCATLLPNCRSEPDCTRRSSANTGRRWMTPPTRWMPNGGCAGWSPSWSGHIRAQRPAWPRTCPRCASICTTSHGCVSGSGPQICWSVRWRK